MFGPAIMPWNWGKVVDKHRSTKPEDYTMQQGNPFAGMAKRRQALEAARKAAGMQQGGSVMQPPGQQPQAQKEDQGMFGPAIMP